MNCCTPTFIIVNNYYVLGTAIQQPNNSICQADGINDTSTCNTTTEGHPVQPPSPQSMQSPESIFHGTSPKSIERIPERLASETKESQDMVHEQNSANGPCRCLCSCNHNIHLQGCSPLILLVRHSMGPEVPTSHVENIQRWGCSASSSAQIIQGPKHGTTIHLPSWHNYLQ
ncbi:hypothetical protein CEUSTIGMA_g12781.t1 [Chlamydomonas eustigma]|uniref:Uncharacterized protein n=1 Tax=Chlamydomonas eustigma TaxID=1157962 RepID=A0A250XQN1_9CHLO|nr:hypothetical protein CEUSTIGMA_g12781.t1 [Chlamydomonas eustigma]|eukprot:GAX85364.1 hypothetical protein CEUSTIGMA_g12781.t1 [Chlamydomonas eustigma]